ncbi:unnamed protein product [Candidula unifasciata]|uniref:Uncharacterized protein n=1 Tax=Candidula unifasciata TaxID=100452 RepID=A0A8S3YCK4_9EUPU|nr:unnamed protein product [Candidula unifasciata]
MSSSHKQKHRTGIPVFKITPRNECEDVNVSSARSQQTLPLDSQQQQSRSTSRNQQSQNQKRDNTVVQPKLKTTKKNQGAETWADEVIQSQGQILRNISVSDSKRRRDDLEKQLHEAEAQLVTMGKLLEQREKLMNEAAEEAAKKTAELEQKLINQDGHLVKYGIDPVTGMQITLDEEGEKKVEATEKFTKKRVQEMRAKLQQMNSQAESHLSDIENTLQFLNGLELAVDRAGQSSGSVLQGFDIDYGDDKQLDQICHQHAGSGVCNAVVRSVLGEKKPLLENVSIGVTVNDDDGDIANCRYLEDHCDKLGIVEPEKLGNVDILDAESAVEEKIS